MPPSVAERRVRSAPAGQALAIAAEVLFLVNLMLAPGLAFLILATLYLRHRRSAPPLARNHLLQTFAASLWAGGLLVVANLAIVLLGGYQAPSTWVVAILWFICVHATLILLGVLGLVKAFAGQTWRFPVIGPALVHGED